jgi:4-coumarate--CoA ligase
MLARRLLFRAVSARPAAPRFLRRPAVLSTSPLSFRPFSVIVHESPHPEVNIPNKTIWDIVGDQLSVHADKPAFIDGLTHEHITFKQLHERARRLAIALSNDGVKRGDVRGRLASSICLCRPWTDAVVPVAVRHLALVQLPGLPHGGARYGFV